jgi:hypothetical protein
MNHSIRLALAVVLAASSTGCVVAIGSKDFERSGSRWAEIERDNRDAIDTLRLGMGVREAQSTMPHPANFSEAFVVDGVAYRALFYRTQRVAGDGMTRRDETTPLVFADGALIGWGAAAWREATGQPLAAID